MWADALTKEMEMNGDIETLLNEGDFKFKNEGINKVQCIDGEIKMVNIWNRKKEEEEEEKDHNS